MSERKRYRYPNSDKLASPKGSDEINISDEELEDAVAQINPYYEKVAAVYSAVRYILLIFLIAFVTFFAIKNSESITYDNLMFLMKDLGSVAELTDENFGRITYNPDSSVSFAGFRRNLAVAASSGLKVYKGDGSLIFGGEDKFSSPRAETSDRYILVYDFGGDTYVLYNSFARIHKDRFDYPITCAAISDSGMYAVVTKTKEYNSAVMLYNKNCRLRGRYLSEDRTVDVSLNADGSRICILSFDADNSSFITKIKIAKPGEDKAVSMLSLEDAFPLSCGFTSDGNLTVLCDKAIYFYDGDGNLLGSSNIDGNIDSAYISDGGAAIASSDSIISRNESLKFFDGSGEIIYSGVSNGKVSSVTCADGALFALSENILTKIDVESGNIKTKEVKNGGKKIIAYSANDVMICSDSAAEYYDFSK